MLVLGENTAPGVSVIPLPAGVGVKLPVVQNVGKIAARFVDLFIELNAR